MLRLLEGGGYEGLFDDFDIHSKDLGKTPDKRNSLISAVISKPASRQKITQSPETK